jgi:predicted HicB family RNase H-like nuclease
MTVSKAQQKATNKYISKAYDRINLTIPKGQKQILQAQASAVGLSVNAYINAAIKEKIERDKGPGGICASTGEET